MVTVLNRKLEKEKLIKDFDSLISKFDFSEPKKEGIALIVQHLKEKYNMELIGEKEK